MPQAFKALLLNLDRDTARLDHMRRQLAAAGIKFERQAGVLGDAVPDDLKPYFFDASGQSKTTMKRGEVGCYASHLRALTRVAAGELGAVALIMEDDLTLTPDFLALLKEALRVLPEGWDILRLSNPPRRAYVPLMLLKGERMLVRYSKIPNSAGAYLVTQVGAQKFLQQGVRGLTFDDDLRRPWFHDMETLGIVPPPVKAGALASSIDAIEAGRFDKGISSRRERINRGDHRHMFKRMMYNVRDLGLFNWFACGLINVGMMITRSGDRAIFLDRAARLFLIKEANPPLQ